MALGKIWQAGLSKLHGGGGGSSGGGGLLRAFKKKKKKPMVSPTLNAGRDRATLPKVRYRGY